MTSRPECPRNCEQSSASVNIRWHERFICTEHAFLEPTFKRAATIWWAWFWRTALLSMAATLLIGIAEGVVLSFAGAPSGNLQFLPIASGAIAGVPVAIYVLQVTLRKNFKEFTICLKPRKVSLTPPVDPI
jgi:hypothetical protein